MTQASWPGPARKPEPLPPAGTAPTPAAVLLAVAREFAGLAAALAVLAIMLLLIDHIGSAAP